MRGFSSVLVVTTTIGCVSAQAADMASPDLALPPPDMSAPFDWTGLRAGIQIGYADSKADIADTAGATRLRGELDLAGLPLGVFAGFDYQFEPGFVIGIEADANWHGTGSDREQLRNAATGALVANQFAEAELEWDASVRGRLGWAFDRFLPYVTAGLATAQFSHERAGGTRINTYDTRLAGYVIGGGLDYAFNNHVFGRLDYRYTDYGTEAFTGGGTAPNNVNNHEIDLAAHSVRIGVGAKF